MRLENLSFISADDMGLGKTLTMISLVKKQNELRELAQEQDKEHNKEKDKEQNKEGDKDKDQGEKLQLV